MKKFVVIIATMLCFASCCCSNRTESASEVETLGTQVDTTVVADTVATTDTVAETSCQE